MLKKFLFFLLLSLVLMSSITTGKSNKDLFLLNVDSNEVEPSRYLTVFENGYYTTPVTLRKNDVQGLLYQIPENASIEEKNLPPLANQSFGFKVNGEFFTKPKVLEKTGFYQIKIYTYSEGVSPIRPERELRSFFIFVDLEEKKPFVSADKTSFYYEHFSSSEELVVNVEESLRGYSLSPVEKETIRQYWNNNDNQNYHNGLVLELFLQEVNINLFFDSVRNPDTEGEVLINERDKTAILIDVSPVNQEALNQTVSEYCSSNVFLCIRGLEFKTTNGTIINEESITFSSNQEIIPLQSSVNFRKGNNVEISFEDNFGNIYSVERELFFYHSIRHSNRNLLLSVQNLEFKQYSSVNEDEILEKIDFYTEFVFGSHRVRDYGWQVITSHGFRSINTNSVGEGEVSISLENHLGENANFVYNYKVLDENPPRILKRVSPIILDHQETFVFENFFRVIDESKIEFVNYYGFDVNEIEENGYTWITVETEDEYGNQTQETFKIYMNIEETLSFYERRIQPFLYRLRSFIYGG